jgi:acyltransferase
MRAVVTVYDRAVSSARTRSVAIDMVRVLAIVAVVARHNWYDPDGWVSQVVCPWAIAVFFVLTGYLWSAKRDLGTEVRNRYRGLLIPYMTWMILISVPFFTWEFFHFTDERPEVILQFFATGYGAQLMVVPYSACWFFTTMFFAAVFMRYLERYPRWVTWAVMGGTLLITVVVPKLLWFGPLGTGLALPCMLFILFGQELRQHRASITRPGLTGVAFIVAGGVAVWLGASHDLNGELIEIKNSIYGFPVAGLVSGAVIGLGLVLIAEALDPIVPPAIGPSVTETASTATFIMFLHPVILFVLGVSDEPFGNWPTFLAAFFVPYLLALACLRLKVFPWLTGVWVSKKVALPVAK